MYFNNIINFNLILIYNDYCYSIEVAILEINISGNLVLFIIKYISDMKFT